MRVCVPQNYWPVSLENVKVTKVKEAREPSGSQRIRGDGS